MNAIDELTKTQKEFEKFVNENLAQNQIIGYTSKGHFGSTYALSAIAKKHKAKLINFFDLLQKRKKEYAFPIIKIIVGIVSGFISIFTPINAQAMANTIVSNTEYVFDPTEKESLFLKYLGKSKFSKAFSKIRKPRLRHIIYVKDYSLLNRLESRYMKILINEINNGNLPNVGLVLRQDVVGAGNFSQVIKNSNIPNFCLSKNDLNVVYKNFRGIDRDFDESESDLISKLGMIFFENFADVLLGLRDEQKDNEILDNLINKMLQYKNIDRNDVWVLLEFVSLLDDTFDNLLVARFKNVQINPSNLQKATIASIICKLAEKPEKYMFYKRVLKKYFYDKYTEELPFLPTEALAFLELHLPFSYIAHLDLMQIYTLNSQPFEEKLITAFFFYSIYGNTKSLQYIKELAVDNCTALQYLKLFADFQIGNLTAVAEPFSNLFSRINSNYYTPIVNCIMILLLLQIRYEKVDACKETELLILLENLKSNILLMGKNSEYDLFWSNYFKEQLIVFSLEYDILKKTCERFQIDSQNYYSSQTNAEFAQKHNLIFKSRTVLLANTIYNTPTTTARNILKKAFESEKTLIYKELLRINFSANLIESGDYITALNILRDNPQIKTIQDRNISTFVSYQNNLLLSEFLNGEMTASFFATQLETILQSPVSLTSDGFIIKNNLATAYLHSSKNANKGLDMLIDLSEKSDEYHSFFAKHNLLAYYYNVGDVFAFESILPTVKVPLLLKNYSGLFQSKFRQMLEQIGMPSKKVYFQFNEEDLKRKHYCQIYLWGSIERWFE